MGKMHRAERDEEQSVNTSLTLRTHFPFTAVSSHRVDSDASLICCPAAKTENTATEDKSCCLTGGLTEWKVFRDFRSCRAQPQRLMVKLSNLELQEFLGFFFWAIQTKKKKNQTNICYVQHKLVCCFSMKIINDAKQSTSRFRFFFTAIFQRLTFYPFLIIFHVVIAAVNSQTLTAKPGDSFHKC